MDITDLTLGQIKELVAMFDHSCPSKATSIFGELVGKYVLVRSRNEGVNAGYVSEAGKGYIVLKDARRLWYHKAKIGVWYEGVANSGVSDDSKLSPMVDKKVIVEDYSVTLCSGLARLSIQEHEYHEPS